MHFSTPVQRSWSLQSASLTHVAQPMPVVHAAPGGHSEESLRTRQVPSASSQYPTVQAIPSLSLQLLAVWTQPVSASEPPALGLQASTVHLTPSLHETLGSGSLRHSFSASSQISFVHV